jgi:hypothetical protein
MFAPAGILLTCGDSRRGARLNNAVAVEENRDQQAAPLTPEEKEAQFHYKVALRALQDSNLTIAGRELETGREASSK